MTPEDAASLERSFHQFMESRLTELVAGRREDPALPRRCAVSAGKAVSTLPLGFLDTHPCRDAMVKRLSQSPKNETCRAVLVLPRRRWSPFTRRRRVLAVVPVCDQRALLERGYVAAPAGASLVTWAQSFGATGREDAVIAFSPTGWEEDFSPGANTVLVSPDGKGGWRASGHVEDPHLASLIQRIFDTESESAKVDRCHRAILRSPAHAFPLSARAVAAEQVVTPQIAAQAFHALASGESAFRVTRDPAQDDWLLDLA